MENFKDMQTRYDNARDKREDELDLDLDEKEEVLSAAGTFRGPSVVKYRTEDIEFALMKGCSGTKLRISADVLKNLEEGDYISVQLDWFLVQQMMNTGTRPGNVIYELWILRHGSKDPAVAYDKDGYGLYARSTDLVMLNNIRKTEVDQYKWKIIQATRKEIRSGQANAE